MWLTRGFLAPAIHNSEPQFRCATLSKARFLVLPRIKFANLTWARA